MRMNKILSVCFFFNDTPTTEIYTLSLHDALPISQVGSTRVDAGTVEAGFSQSNPQGDRKSTRLNSRHRTISYAVSCLNKKSIAIEGRSIVDLIYESGNIKRDAGAQ